MPPNPNWNEAKPEERVYRAIFMNWAPCKPLFPLFLGTRGALAMNQKAGLSIEKGQTDQARGTVEPKCL